MKPRALFYSGDLREVQVWTLRRGGGLEIRGGIETSAIRLDVLNLELVFNTAAQRERDYLISTSPLELTELGIDQK